MQHGLVFKVQRAQTRKMSTKDLPGSAWEQCSRKFESIQAALSSHILGSSLPLIPRWLIHTQKSRQLQIYLSSCVSIGIYTSQATAQILYRKFPLLSKNSRPLCTTLLLKFWSPGTPAFNSSSFSSLGNPSLSVPLALSQSLVEHFCSSLR